MTDGATLLKEYNAGRVSYALLAKKHGLTRNQVAGRIRDARVSQRTKISDKLVYIQPQIVHTDPLPTLTSLNDRDRWQSTLKDVLNSKRFITVMHRCDVHNPYGDPAALALWDELANILKPDIVARGSDEDDLPTISVFVERGADVPEVEIDDFLDQMYVNRMNDTKRIKNIVPSAVQVNIEGNHGYPRLRTWINKKAKESKTTLYRRYIENIRCGGDVSFIGFKQSVRINDLIVAHGKRYGMNAPKQTLQDRKFHWSVLAGHSHKPGMFTTVGKYPVTSIISGCMCLIPADYNQEEDDLYSEWQHGTAYATIDTKTGIVDCKDIRFNRSENLMWFELGGRIYAHEIEGLDVRKAV